MDPRAVEVRAGDSHRASPDTRGEVQRRGVALVRIHPNRNLAEDPSARDIAVLHLSRPVEVTPTVSPVALPAPATLPAEGQGGRLAGFGRQTPEAPASGQLYAFDATVGSPMCAGAANAVLFCASSPASSTCSGDSGSGFVVFTPTPVLVGVAVAGPASCAPGTARVMSKVAAPEILRFVYGDPAPTPAPRALGGAQLRVPHMREGHVAQCLSPAWSPAASLAFTFFDESGRALASGPSSTYQLRSVDAGRRLGCQVTASSAGGTGVMITGLTVTQVVRARPALRVATTRSRRGRRVLVRVALEDIAGRRARVRVCVAAVRRTSSRSCRTVRLRGLERMTFRVPVRVRKGTRPGRKRVRVSVELHGRKPVRGRGVLLVRR